MAGVEIFEIAVAVENPEKHGGVPADLGVLAKEIIDVMEDARGIGAEGHARQGALEHGGEQRGANSFPGNVGDDEGGAVVAHRKHVEVIAAQRRGREY